MEFGCFQFRWCRVHDHAEGDYIALEFEPVVDLVANEKMSGVPADSVLESLSPDATKRLVTEVAMYCHQMFSVCFDQAGSLYGSSTPDKFFVGPIISSPFYRALDGLIRINNVSLLSALSSFRGPFGTVSDYVSSWIKAELYILSQDPSIPLSELDGNRERLQQGQRVLEKVRELCAIYPGDLPVYEGATTRRFSLKLDDFRLSNIMVRSHKLSV